MCYLSHGARVLASRGSMPYKTLLVVADDADQRLGYRLLLPAHQYETHVAPDAAKAMSDARQHRPDLILLDMGLLAGDGFLLLQRLQASSYLKKTPVIAVSADGSKAHTDRALASGARACLQKP